MTAALLKPVVTGFPVSFAPTKSPSKQICTYTVVLESKIPLGPDFLREGFAEPVETFRVSFDHVIDRTEIENWLEPWFELDYELIEVSPCEWQVQNPITGIYESIWVKN
ncbi:MAG: hypothetical protein N5P05_003665 [Chroococcopsis gigantea SAG 12.99]|jgi:hypothetical protein|nr:hypothetical protein [Chlorogloea purpurea SAG 13.99]MDV3002059.1 hypothetical protein [Chroococcopsis gigantea SAG 12.99]